MVVVSTEMLLLNIKFVAPGHLTGVENNLYQGHPFDITQIVDKIPGI